MSKFVSNLFFYLFRNDKNTGAIKRRLSLSLL